MHAFKELINLKKLSALTGIPYQKLDNNVKGVSKSLRTADFDNIKTVIKQQTDAALDALAINCTK